nr:hypothetical protein [Lachnospiraceae bacterium]
CIMSGCSEKSDFNSDYTFGVVETTGERNKSYLRLFDNDCKEIGKIVIKDADIDMTPIETDKNFILVPNGVIGIGKDKADIVVINKATGEVEEESAGNDYIATSCIEDEDIVYYNSDNYPNNIIASYNRTNGETYKYEDKDYFYIVVSTINDNIICCGDASDMVDDKYVNNSKLLLFEDEKLENPKEVDISEYCARINDIIYYNDNYYVAANWGYNESGDNVTLKEILVFDKNFNYLKTINTDCNVSKLFIYNQKLYAVGYDKYLREGNYVYEIENDEVSETKYLENRAQFVSVKDNLIYVANDENVAIYDMDNDFSKVSSNDDIGRIAKKGYSYIGGVCAK